MFSRNIQYSAKELELFNAFDIEKQTITCLKVMQLYDLLMGEAFCNNMQGPHVDALRRACKALLNGYPKRCTHEFDALITFAENK